MFSTIVAVFVLVLLLFLGGLWALLLRIGLRWAKVSDVTTRRIVLAIVFAFAVQIGVNILLLLILPDPVGQTWVFALLNLTAAAVVPCVLASTIFKAHFRQAWLPLLVATMTLALVFVLRPLLCDAFVMPTNGMAPTLVGQHWQSICPECGQPCFCSPLSDRFGPPGPPLMVCDNFHTTHPSNIDKRIHAGDRFFTAKFLSPRRWDIVVFEYPTDPTKLYAKRLVGLPGEEIYISDGSVWINGKRQSPPDSIQGIQYTSELPGSVGTELWGSVHRPACLGKDEYFVLGDFSAQTNDSRMWDEGVPGYNPFAVPKSHLVGVVTHTYWPPHRWRIHR